MKKDEARRGPGERAGAPAGAATSAHPRRRIRGAVQSRREGAHRRNRARPCERGGSGCRACAARPPPGDKDGEAPEVACATPYAGPSKGPQADPRSRHVSQRSPAEQGVNSVRSAPLYAASIEGTLQRLLDDGAPRSPDGRGPHRDPQRPPSRRRRAPGRFPPERGTRARRPSRLLPRGGVFACAERRHRRAAAVPLRRHPRELGKAARAFRGVPAADGPVQDHRQPRRGAACRCGRSRPPARSWNAVRFSFEGNTIFVFHGHQATIFFERFNAVVGLLPAPRRQQAARPQLSR